jgi:hypothetical protein
VAFTRGSYLSHLSRKKRRARHNLYHHLLRPSTTVIVLIEISPLGYMFDCNFCGFFSKLMLRRGNSAKRDAPDRRNIACPPGHDLETSDNGREIRESQNQAIHVQHDPVAPPAKHNLIHGLPPEIMRIIFLSALERSKVRNLELKRVIRTGYVCRRWRDILNSMKCFWNDIQIRRGDPWPRPNVSPFNS